MKLTTSANENNIELTQKDGGQMQFTFFDHRTGERKGAFAIDRRMMGELWRNLTAFLHYALERPVCVITEKVATHCTTTENGLPIYLHEDALRAFRAGLAYSGSEIVEPLFQEIESQFPNYGIEFEDLYDLPHALANSGIRDGDPLSNLQLPAVAENGDLQIDDDDELDLIDDGDELGLVGDDEPLAKDGEIGNTTDDEEGDALDDLL